MEKTLETHLFTRLPSDFLVVGLFSHLTNPIQNRVKKSEIDHFQAHFKQSQTNKNTKNFVNISENFYFFPYISFKDIDLPSTYLHIQGIL